MHNNALDPRTKLFMSLVFAVSVFIANSLPAIIAAAASLIILIILSKVPLKQLTKRLLPIIFILFLTDLIIILTTRDHRKAIISTVRVTELALIFNLLSLTTKPRDAAATLEKLTHSHDLATMLAIAMRFIPILADEAVRIIQAQKARGADFNGSIIKRARQTAPILVPLFVSAFRKADELSIAMDARFYGSAEPSRLHPLHLSKSDLKALILTLLYLSAVIVAEALC